MPSTTNEPCDLNPETDRCTSTCGCRGGAQAPVSPNAVHCQVSQATLSLSLSPLSDFSAFIRLSRVWKSQFLIHEPSVVPAAVIIIGIAHLTVYWLEILFFTTKCYSIWDASIKAELTEMGVQHIDWTEWLGTEFTSISLLNGEPSSKLNSVTREARRRSGNTAENIWKAKLINIVVTT
jgi:hypothetical protein